jgi:hypothetical protein
MSAEKPSAAYVLSLVGGIFVVIGGLATAAIGAVFTFMIGGIGGIFGVLGIVWGILIIYFATRLNSDPAGHSTSGALIIVFSLLSWFGGLGGFFIGFLLALIGGILAITWSPRTQPTSMPPPPVGTMAGMKYCASCGTQMSASATFCPKCGAKQP